MADFTGKEDFSFLDTEILVNDTSNRSDGSDRNGKTVRPWTKFWPPTPGGELFEWLKQECPDALTWRFDPSDPYCRPWHNWSKLFVKRICRATILPPKPSEMRDDNNGSRTATVERAPAQQAAVFPRQGHNISQEQNGVVIPQEFRYLANLELHTDEKPYHSRLPYLNGLPRTNIVAQAYNNVSITDISQSSSGFMLDREGFQYMNMPIPAIPSTSDIVKKQYLPDLSRWLRQHFACKEAHIYTFNLRCAGQVPSPEEPWIGPYLRAHCDVTAASSVSRLSLHLPGREESLKSERVRFIGIWRLLNGPGVNCPLAFCDARTVNQNDLVPADIVFPHFCDEGYEVKYNPAHRWYYKKQMTRDEVVIFKLADSENNCAQYCPHSAFYDPTTDKTAPDRASIEVRAILIC